MARRKKHGDHENHERWLLTYADMITLLVAFFMMLYAMSVSNKAKFEELALSVRSGFGGNSRFQAVPLSPGTGIAQSNALIAPEHLPRRNYRVHGKRVDFLKNDPGGNAEEESMEAAKKRIEAIAKAHGMASMIDISETQRGLIVRILTDKLLFTPGDGHLQAGSVWILDGIASAVQGLPNDLAVEGHTDSQPIHNASYPSNWELSTDRATSVLRYLIERDHVAPERICAAGYADTRPLADNTTAAGRARNRRVDIVVLRTSGAESDAGDGDDGGGDGTSGGGGGVDPDVKPALDTPAQSADFPKPIDPAGMAGPTRIDGASQTLQQ